MRGLLLALLTISLVPPANGERPTFERYRLKVGATPDLSQQQRSLPAGGQMHCASVAVSNSLVWLARNGFPRLLEGQASQLALARLLGTGRYMKTDTRVGTNTVHMLSALARYTSERGYRATLQFQGWWQVQDRYRHEEALRVDLGWLLRGIEGKSGAWLNVGWYRLVDPARQLYRRTGGHWVTLIGYDTRRFAGRTERVLLVHDPSARSPEGRHEVVRLTRLKRGRLAGAFVGLPVPAEGVYRLGGQLVVEDPQRSGKIIPLLDGAVVMRLR